MIARLITLFLLCAFSSHLNAQDVRLINGGFEGNPHVGRLGLPVPPKIDGWFDCGRIQFPNETPPDLHQGVNRDTAYWDNEQGSIQGKTYLGMVVRESETYESLSQRLAMPLMAGRCYSFHIFLSRSEKYLSALAANNSKKKNFTAPTVLRVWGGEGFCDTKELLCESDPVDHSEWKEYIFKIEPSANYQFIRIEAFYKTPVLFPYNGHILIDGASDFDLIECEENIELYIAEKREETALKQRRMPAHKAKKRNQEVFNRGQKEIKIDTIVYERPKDKILSLERNNLKKGQNIRIDKLYFSADTSAIDVESFQVLNEVFEFLAINKDINVEIGGHTNNIPSHDYCNKLSTERAKAVADYLVKKGIEDERVSFKGYGKRKPVSSNGTAIGRKKNQRVEIKIISIG